MCDLTDKVIESKNKASLTILKKNHHSKRLQKSTVKKEWVKVIEISIQQSTPIIRFTTASTEYPLITSNHQTTY